MNYLYSWVSHACPHERTCVSLTLFTLQYRMYCRDGNTYSQHELFLTLFTHEYKMYCRFSFTRTVCILNIYYPWIQNTAAFYSWVKSAFDVRTSLLLHRVGKARAYKTDAFTTVAKLSMRVVCKLQRRVRTWDTVGYTPLCQLICRNAVYFEGRRLRSAKNYSAVY